MLFTRRLALLLVTTLLTALGSNPVSAQITSVTDTTSTPSPGIGHDYLQFLNETVNPANGSLSLRIQVPVPPGRKLTIPFAFAYDSNGVHHFVFDSVGGLTWLSNQSFISQGGWGYLLPMLSVSLAQTTFVEGGKAYACLLYTSPSPRDRQKSRMPSSA